MSARLLQVLVADDEPIARRGLADLIDRHPDVELVGEARGGREAIHLVETLRPDIVILDVEMPAVDGFAVVAALPTTDRPELIFVTAHDDFALRGFDANAVDYVLKPYSAARLHEALSRAVLRRHDRLAAHRLARVVDAVGADDSGERSADPMPFAERLMVNVGRRGILVPTSSIILLEADGACVRIRTSTTSYTLREALTLLERRLDPRHFLRVHRSALVRIAAVRMIERISTDRIALLLEGDLKVPVSRTRRESVLNALADVRG